VIKSLEDEIEIMKVFYNGCAKAFNSRMRFKVLRVQELFVGPACSLLPFNDEPSQPIIAFEAVPVDSPSRKAFLTRREKLEGRRSTGSERQIFLCRSNVNMSG
jgi:hypothetical protein